MATYTVQLGHTVGAGSDYTFELPAVTIASSEQFKRCRIRRAGTSCESYMRLRGNAQDVLGQNGFDTWTTDKTAISWTNGKSPKVKVHNTGSSAYSWRVFVDIETEDKPLYNINCYGNVNGNKLTANKTQAYEGQTITLYPEPATGYRLTGYTNNRGVTISNNKFTMPANNISVTAAWEKINYAITKQSSPAGAGTVNGPATAQYGDTVTLSQTPAAGYAFSGWSSSPALTISNNQFAMPAQAVTVTANYRQRSTATLNKTTLEGGGTALLTINAASTGYSHKYKLSFGTGMETEETDVAAGVTGVTIQIPTGWADQIPAAESKSGGTLTLSTYSGTTLIGTYQITGLVYAVPEDAVPEIGEIITSIVRSIGGTDYANVGDVYVQGHCGIRVQAEAEGAMGATITGMAVSAGGFSGTAADDEIDFTSGLLTQAGPLTVTVTATDSRGRTATATEQVTVQAYAPPAGTLHVWRVDLAGNEDDVNKYAKYAIASQYTEVGTNSLTRTLSAQGYSAAAAQDTGDVLPGSGNRQEFLTTQEFTITLTLQDAFETTTITARLQSAKFIIFAAADGDRLAFFKASSKAVPTGKDSVIEISADTQVYIGNDTLEDYIRSIINT